MKTYTLTHPAYGQPAGTTVALDDSDPLVQMNVDNGVLIPGKDNVLEQKMTCPICAETMKRPTKLSSDQELVEHYQDKHAAFEAPSWQPDTEEE